MKDCRWASVCLVLGLVLLWGGGGPKIPLKQYVMGSNDGLNAPDNSRRTPL